MDMSYSFISLDYSIIGRWVLFIVVYFINSNNKWWCSSTTKWWCSREQKKDYYFRFHHQRLLLLLVLLLGSRTILGPLAPLPHCLPTSRPHSHDKGHCHRISHSAAGRRERMASLAVESDETGIDTESTSSDGKDVAPPKYDKAQLLVTIKTESEEEENALADMRKEDRYAEELLPQETIVRFLRARDHDLAKSKLMLDNHLKFRSKWIPQGLESCKPSDIMPALQSGCWAVGGLTKDGCPILYVDTNLWNPADYTVEIYVKYLCFFFERLHLVFPEDRHQVVIILDMSGWQFSDVFYLNYIRHLVDINQNQYPERLRYCNLINVPWFSKVLGLLSSHGSIRRPLQR